MSDESFQLKLIKINKILDVTFYSGSIRLGDLFNHFDVPIYKTGVDVTADGGGYQREASPSRVTDVAIRITKKDPGQEIPNADAFVDNINLNIRSVAAEMSYVKPLDEKYSEFGDVHTFDYIDKLGKFYIVDGQTRLKGAHQAYRNAMDNKEFKLADDIKNLRLQITLTFCEDKYKEAYIFYLINQHSKKIPTSGATRLLYEGQVHNSISFVNEINRSQKFDDVDTMKMVQYLSDHSDVWAGNIADFNESNKNKIPINTFVRISKSLYKKVRLHIDTLEDSSIKPHDLTSEIVEAFWCGIKQAYPIMFAMNNNTKFNILNAGTVEVLMDFLGALFDKSIAGELAKLGQLTDPATFKNLMKDIFDSYEDTNGNDIRVTGVNLFIIGKEGVFGKYGNSQEKKNASKKIMLEAFKVLGMAVP